MSSSMLSLTTFSSRSSHLSNFFLGSGFFWGVNKRNPIWGWNESRRISSGNLSFSYPLRSSRLVTYISTEAGKPISVSESMNQGGSGANVETRANDFFFGANGDESNFSVGVISPNLPKYFPLQKLSLIDQVFFLMAFIACTTSLAFASFVAASVPTLHAIGRVAISLSKLADTAREELPSTMAAVRLSGMEISDLTLELSDLSQEIADGVNKSTQAVQAADVGIRRIGSLARQQTISMIQERANLPIISIQTVVSGAAKKTSRAVGRAIKSFMNMISRGEFRSNNNYDKGSDRIEP